VQGDLFGGDFAAELAPVLEKMRQELRAIAEMLK
jgi:hypothetical protein